MKRKIRTCAMIAVLTLSMAGCQKDNLLINEPNHSNITMRYSVSGNDYTSFSYNEREFNDLDSFFDQVFALVNEGYTVNIIGNRQGKTKEKKKVVFTTTDESEAKSWAASMTLLGYSVQISHDSSTGIYTCVATL